MNRQQRLEIEAATFRRLIEHLRQNPQVQNIELMSVAGFCRNCLAKWYKSEAAARSSEVDYEAARELVYSMSYRRWKERYQIEATPEQMQAFEEHQRSSDS